MFVSFMKVLYTSIFRKCFIKLSQQFYWSNKCWRFTQKFNPVFNVSIHPLLISGSSLRVLPLPLCVASTAFTDGA